jgi:hypothetical protein
MRRRSLWEVVADRRAARAACRAGQPPSTTLPDRLANRPNVTQPKWDPAVERRLGEALHARAAERDERDERAAMAWDDPGCPREPESPAQGWRDWWLPDER